MPVVVLVPVAGSAGSDCWNETVTACTLEGKLPTWVTVTESVNGSSPVLVLDSNTVGDALAVEALLQLNPATTMTAATKATIAAWLNGRWFRPRQGSVI